jgi:hypothetical protein
MLCDNLVNERRSTTQFRRQTKGDVLGRDAEYPAISNIGDWPFALNISPEKVSEFELESFFARIPAILRYRKTLSSLIYPYNTIPMYISKISPRHSGRKTRPKDPRFFFPSTADVSYFLSFTMQHLFREYLFILG